MSEPLVWGRRGRRPTSPFDKHEARPLKLTLHILPIDALDPKEERALAALRDLCLVDGVEVVSTEDDGLSRWLAIDPIPDSQGFHPVRIRRYVEGESDDALNVGHYSGPRAADCARLARTLAGRGPSDDREVSAALADVLVCEAHLSIHYDLLVTHSKWLSHPEHRRYFSDANVCKPSAALKLLGLHLRGRGIYAVTRRVTIDRGAFFEILAKERVRHLWRYQATVCRPGRTDDTAALGRTVVDRCERVLKARDHIAEWFCGTQQGRHMDEALYHFDYLTLLLQGALDAQARVVCRAYGYAKERNAALHSENLLDFLLTAEAALHAAVTGEQGRAVLTILKEVRNTIHGAMWNAGRSTDANTGRVAILLKGSPLAQTLWAETGRIGDSGQWGLSKRVGRLADGSECTDLLLDLSTFTDELVRRALSLIDEICLRTDTTRLFDTPALSLPSTRPERGIDNGRVRERIDLLAE